MTSISSELKLLNINSTAIASTIPTFKPISFPNEIFILIVKELTSDILDIKAMQAYLAFSKTCYTFYEQYYADSTFLNIYRYYLNIPFICLNAKPDSIGYQPFTIVSFWDQAINSDLLKSHYKGESTKNTKGYQDISKIRRKIKEEEDIVIKIQELSGYHLLDLNGNERDEKIASVYGGTSYDDWFDLDSDSDSEEDKIRFEANWSSSWFYLVERNLRLCRMKELRETFDDRYK